jgi:BirA family biotin operon repressor/biotin-[acetyl-CoA-carboxylase] ligase
MDNNKKKSTKICVNPRQNNYPEFLEVITLDVCDSTNSYLKIHYDHLKDKLPVLVTAALQTGGRGRESRTWVSLKDKGLYSSFGFSMDSNKNLHFLPLLSGITVIETLKKISDIELELGLKWPNDVLYNGKKIAGILIENTIFENHVFCVTGVGINLNHTKDDFPGELAQKAISLKMITGSTYKYKAETINPLLADIFFNGLEKLGNKKNEGEKEKIIQTANRYSRFLKEREIQFFYNHQITRGIFKGINSDGGLILEANGGNTTLYYSGEIV